MRLAIASLLAAAAAFGQVELEVQWKKTLARDKQGTLRIDEEGFAFQPDDERARPRSWPYLDIQHFDRVGAAEIEILSYEDAKLQLGRDRRYRFVLLEGQFDDALMQRVAARIGKPVTDRLPAAPEDADLVLPVKHLKRRGSSQGSLYLTMDRIVYVSPTEKRSRDWRLDRDVAAVWSSDPYRLEVHAFDGRETLLRQPTVYRFALKRPLDGAFYRRLKLRIHDLRPPGADGR